MRLALYQPDIPQNAAAVLRTAVCLDVGVDLIESAGFLFGERQFRRAGLDYAERARLARHADWASFRAARAGSRLVLLTTRAAVPYIRFAFAADDVLLLGRESAGVPDDIHAAVDARVRIPLAEGARSLNVAIAGAIVLAEALRQTGGLPAE